MRTIGIYILRAVWLFLLFAWIWNIATGKALQSFHPFNLVLIAAVFVGALTIWFSARPARILSGICGVVVALMMGFQFLALISLFNSETRTQLRVSFGPFGFQGNAAQAFIWLTPLLLLGLSTALLFSELRFNVSPFQDDSQKSESA